MRNLIYACLIFTIITSCKDDTPEMEPLIINGLTYGNSNKTFEEANNNIIAALNGVAAIKIVAEIDHSANAVSVNETLLPTKVILFGNPALGTPLMQKNQLAGLDLPQKMLLFQDEDAQLKVAYNRTDYLAQRHGLAGVAALATIAGALSNFASAATTEQLVNAEVSVGLNEGIIIKNSTYSFEETYAKLVGIITKNENLKLIAELDHQANAASINLELRPTRLVVFGNPNLGSPLMQSMQTIGIDLPQKMLVFENEAGEIQVAYNDVAYLAKRHGITGNDDTLSTITDALNNISNGATN